jgi:deoxyribonuclease IV
MRLGTHCSIAGGVSKALEEAARLGCDTLQLFTQSPRIWKGSPPTDAAVESFRALRQKTGLSPLVIHLPYLPNLCTADASLYAKSIQTLESDLTICERLGVEYLVVHPGSYSDGCGPEHGVDALAKALDQAFKNVPGKAMVLLENMAGSGKRLGGKFEELAAMRQAVRDKSRVGFCLDTAHTIAAGYGFSTADEVNATLKEFDSVLGLSHLKVIHANDSKAPRGSRRDLHQHIGDGFVGLEAFRTLVNYPAMKDIPFILETPKDTPEDDPRNLKSLRALARE